MILLKDFILLFLDRREGREKEKERNINVWSLLQAPHWACVLAGNRTSDPFVRRLALNPLSHTSQGTILILKNSSEVLNRCLLETL